MRVVRYSADINVLGIDILELKTVQYTALCGVPEWTTQQCGGGGVGQAPACSP